MFTLRRLRRCQGFLMQSLRSFSGYADGRGNYTIIPGVLQLGDERLRVLSQTVELPAMLDSSSPERKGAALAHAKLQEFRQTMGYGRGIAAPQVNCPIRMYGGSSHHSAVTVTVVFYQYDASACAL
eukprot:m.202320 g.202320  ORF g.202320 m.202320 type:complete len:126 (-) comp18824_c0_seq6:1281-1658(-)